jgi:hypothetical protein
LKETISNRERARKLQEQADAELRAEQYAKSEILYRASIQLLADVLDHMHEDYVQLLKGLLVSLQKQSKADEAQAVSRLIGQLCER